MSSAAANTLRFTLSTDPGGSSSDSLELVQIDAPDEGLDVTVSEIEEMVARARSGLSARTFRRDSCAMSFDVESETITAWYDFAIYPSDIDLSYNLTANMGVLSDQAVSSEYVEFSVVFEKSATVDLGFLLSDVISMTWEYPPHTPDGERISSAPSVAIEGTRLVLDQPAFAVLRVAGRKTFKSCRLSVTGAAADMTEESLQPVVVAEWAGDPVVLELQTSSCVTDTLGLCSDDPDSPFFKADGEGLAAPCVEEDAEKEGSYTAYYSKCSGVVFMVVQNDDGGLCE